jgi:hypothetical protein
MGSRCFKGIAGIIVLLSIASFAVLGCSSLKDESTTTTATTEAPSGLSLSDYKTAMAAIFADLQTAGDAASASLTEAANLAGGDTAAGLAQAQQTQQAAAQWGDAIAAAQTALSALEAPGEAGAVHADFTNFLAGYKASIDKLTAISGYTAGVIAAYGDLEAATAADGVFGQMDALVASDPGDIEGRLPLAEGGKAVLDDFAAQLGALSVPQEFTEVHATISADLATALQTMDQMIQSLSGLIESDSQAGRDELNTLSDQFSSQWATVEQDFATWQSVHDAAEAEWAQGQETLATTLASLAQAINDL